MTPRIVVLAAPSGTGKTTIARALVARRRDVGFSISATTRAPRPGEKDGEAYYFVTRAEFERRRAAGEFVESAEYAGNLYGTLTSEVERLFRAGQHVLLDIEIQGARQVRRHATYGKRCVAIFLLPPSARELASRLSERRTESRDAARRRLDVARTEIRAADEDAFDYVVVNDDLERAVTAVSKIIDGARDIAPRPEGFVGLVRDLDEHLASAIPLI